VREPARVAVGVTDRDAAVSTDFDTGSFRYSTLPTISRTDETFHPEPERAAAGDAETTSWVPGGPAAAEDGAAAVVGAAAVGGSAGSCCGQASLKPSWRWK
jgi:hypothetical protein